MRFSILAGSFAVLAIAAAMAEAGSMTTILTPSARYDDAVDFNPLPLVFAPSGAVANGQPGLYQIDISFTAVNGPGDKGWAETLFDLSVGSNKNGSNLALDLSLPYTPNTGTLDINGSAPGGVTSIYGPDTDGDLPNDLKGIVAGLVSFTIVDTPNDTRNKLGTLQAPAAAGYPSYIGSFFVNWNGQGLGSIVLNNQQYTFSLTSNTYGPVQNGAGAVALFGVPEPGSIMLAGMAVVGLIAFTRGRK